MTDRAEEIRRLWELTTDTGVVVRPTEARVRAVAEKGFDVEQAETLLDEGEELFQRGQLNRLLAHIARINHALGTAPPVHLPGVVRPSELADILREAGPRPELPRYVPGEDYGDRVLGGWLGKVAGGALGMPVEGWSRARIAETFGEVTGYLGAPSTVNDDTAYQVVALHAVEEHGPGFSSRQLGLEWVEHLPRAYTAEEIALANLRQGIFPPDSGSFNNPFSHWIGAMMRGEIFGWLAPGRPEVAVKLAYRDAIISHETEGVYGELFNAAMISAAFVAPDVPTLIDVALGYVPRRSQFAEVVRTVRAWCEEAPSWERAWWRAEQQLAPSHHWIHTFPNLAAVLVALWFGDGDFDRTVCVASMCGEDTDCTAGQTGAVVGTARGASAVGDRWRKPLGDALETYALGLERMPWDGLVARTCAAGEMVLAEPHTAGPTGD